MFVFKALGEIEDALLAHGAASLESNVVRTILPLVQEAKAIIAATHLKKMGEPEDNYRNLRLRPRPPSYADIAISHIAQCQRPSTTYELIDATKLIYPSLVICEGSLKSFRASYSKDRRLRNVIWNKRRHWWLASQDLPPN